MADQTFQIPDWNMGRLQNEIHKLNRRGERIGCPPVEIEVLSQSQKVAPGFEEQAEILGPDYVPHITVYEVSLHGEGPKIAGWKFVGSLDHVSLPGVAVVNTVPGESVPAEYYDHDAVCNHCGKIRRRNDTFVLQHDDGHHTQVGRQCLRDFLGHDPNVIARHLSRIMRFADQLGNEDNWFGGGGSYTYTFDHFTVLRTTAAIIRSDGWVARSACLEGQSATADLVLSSFFPPIGSAEYQHWREWVDSLDLHNEEYAQNAVLAREWLKTQPDNNEYMHNLHSIDQAEAVPTKLFGYWCSLLAAYQRAQERLRLKEATNEWVGAVRQRLDLEISVVSIRSIEGPYGTVYIHRMLDTAGRTFVWFCNAERTMREGRRYIIRGTVKKHDEFRDWKQTVLTRVTVVEEIG